MSDTPTPHGIGTQGAYNFHIRMKLPRCNPFRRNSESAFTLAEVSVAIVISVLFGMAAFAANSRILSAIRAQKENTVATMILQQRMESLRAAAYTSVADKDYVKNLFKSPTSNDADLTFYTLYQQLGSLQEQAAVGVYGDTTKTPNILLRNPSHPSVQTLSNNDNLVTDAANSLLQVDLLLQWTSANGRTRTRTMSAVFGKGNIGN